MPTTFYIEKVDQTIQIGGEGVNATGLYNVYFGQGVGGKFVPCNKDENGDFQSFMIYIGGDIYQAKWDEMRINGNTPTDYADAHTLLLAMFVNLINPVVP
jgi:hypothetical protein